MHQAKTTGAKEEAVGTVFIAPLIFSSLLLQR